MGQGNISERNIDDSNGGTGIKPDMNYAQKEKKYKQSEDMVTVVSKVNRPKNFPVGRGYYYFTPYESKQVARSVVEHNDFKQQANDFIIKES